MAAKTRMQKVLDLAGQFVTERKGVWSHDDWEGFLAKAAALGVAMDDESKRCLGNILESCKGLPLDSEEAAPTKKPAKTSAESKK